MGDIIMVRLSYRTILLPSIYLFLMWSH